MFNRIIVNLKNKVDHDKALEKQLQACIVDADWSPPGWGKKSIADLKDFYIYLNQLMDSTPVDASFDNLFHGLYYIISQQDNALQKLAKFSEFQEWLAIFVEVYGSLMNSSESANNLYSFTHDKTFSIEDFSIPPGGFNTFNTFFSRYIKPGKRPIGAPTFPYESPSAGNPLAGNPPMDHDTVHKNMCDDRVITVPADSVYQGNWPISKDSIITVTKRNKKYSIRDLLKGSQYANEFKGGLFTHSYLTVFTYHRYHVPVRGKVLETKVIAGRVFANVIKKENGDLSATDGTGYQFKQDRGLLVIDSPIVGLVALLPIGMDFISSVNFSVDVGDYLNKGDEFGYFLFGGSDMIMLFQNKNINIALPKKGKLYKLGQVFATVE